MGLQSNRILCIPRILFWIRILLTLVAEYQNMIYIALTNCMFQESVMHKIYLIRVGYFIIKS